MDITLRYFEGCPNWKVAEERLRTAMQRVGLASSHIARERIDTIEAAERLGFRGSPTILIDGDDPFADPSALTGLSCRIYQTEAGPAGAPTVDQFEAALRR